MTRTSFIGLIGLLIGSGRFMESASPQPPSLRSMLAGRQYRRRVVLLYGRADAQQLLLQQQQTLTAAQADLDERQMDVIILRSSELSVADRQFLIEQPFGLNPAHDFRGWLIGKDGGVKHPFDQPTDPQVLFRLVDTMPMRRQEMKH